MLGSRVERAVGSTRSPLVGGSGSLFALLVVAATVDGPGMLAFVTVLVLAVTNIAHAFGAPCDAGVSFGCHIEGLVLGAVVVVLARLLGGDLRRAVAV